MAITTFVGQNIGAKQYDRVKKGSRAALFMDVGSCYWGNGYIIILLGEVYCYIYSENQLLL